MNVPCVCLALCAASCGADTAGCPAPSELSSAHATTADVQTIITRDCALGGCHLRAPGAGGLVLDAGWRAATVGIAAQENPAMALVAPGDPDHSWLAVKVTGAFCGATCDPALGCGARMPFGAPLSEPDRATIVAWIEAGAQ